MKSPFGEKLVKCPVCKKSFLKGGMKNHIINIAKGEVFRIMKDLFQYNKKDFSRVSMKVLLRNMPHFQFYRKNYKITQGKLYV